MEYAVIAFLVMFVFIAKAPEQVTQAALAMIWVLSFLFIAGEVVWISGCFLLSLL